MTLCISVIVVCSVVALFVVEGQTLIPASSVSLSNDGGYTHVVVAIDESVVEDEAIIPAIKRMFTNGSRYLHQATRKQLYFKDVTILIPPTWQRKPDVYGSPGRMTFDTADVIVAPPNPLWSHSPYTHQIQGCGKPGSYIHFMKEFLTNPNFERNYGNLGRVLLHEWGHYRWGLFNEYPDPVGDADHVTYFYQSTDQKIDQKWKAVSCSQRFNVRPMIAVESESGTKFRRCEGNDVSGYEEGCIGIPSDNAGATGSIMYGQLLFNDVADFCDSDEGDPGNLHNREAVNKHNRLCDSKSAWEVMREHPDFKDRNSPPPDRSDDALIPNFNSVQVEMVEYCRIVLVIDTSLSMTGNGRSTRLERAAKTFINLVPEGTWVGIVTFHVEADIKQDLMQVLSSDSSRRKGGIILLMSDGFDLAFNAEKYRNTGVTVYTVIIGKDPLERLASVAEITGGSSFVYADGDSPYELMSSLQETAGRCGQSSRMNGHISDNIQIIENKFDLGFGESETGHFTLDPAIGNQTQIIVTYTMACQSSPGVAINITQPNSVTINPASTEYNIDEQKKFIVINIPDIATSGTWTYTIENKYLEDQMQSATMSVYSRAVSAAEPTITVQSHLSESTLSLSNDVEAVVIYAEVMQGFNPIIDATVNAIVERPGEYSFDVINLYDNGAGADITANDGVYTRSFTNYTETGFYNVSIVAVNDGGAKVMDAAPESRSPVFINITDEGVVIPDLYIGNYSVPLPGSKKNTSYKPVPNFNRSTFAGSTNVSSLPPTFVSGQDLFPPNRIQDLKIRSTSVHNLTLVLTWTAPGDDLDSGTAISYDIRISPSSEALRNNFATVLQVNNSDIVQGHVSEPQPFGIIEEYIISVADIPEAVSFSYAIAVRATDDTGQKGPVSNVAIATFRRSIPVYQCGAKICQHGGKMNSGNCMCLCNDKYQGALCQHDKSQLRNGVQLLFQANVSQCLTLLDPLRKATADVLTRFCNQHVERCCPDSNIEDSAELSTFVFGVEDIYVASGYPVSAESDLNAGDIGSYIVIFAKQPEKTNLCDGRLKQNSVDPQYVAKDILFDALQHGEEAIEDRLATSILNISISVVEGDSTIVQTTTIPTTDSTIPGWAIVVLITFLVTVNVLVLLVVRRRHIKRSKKKDGLKDDSTNDILL